MTYIMPDYLNLDFNTFKENVINSLKETETFKDYNFEGSNISVLIELIAYLSELNTYYLNRISKNLYFDSVDMYENANRLANFVGYSPKGSIGANTLLTMEITATPGIYSLNEWKQVSSTETTDDGDKIYYVILDNKSFTVEEEGSYTITDIFAKQGEIQELSFTGEDIIDNILYLPFVDYGYDDNLNDIYDTIILTVNGDEWTRINSFFDSSSPYANVNTVYQFKYNKYKEYIIEFSGLKSVPSETDEIEIRLIKTLGNDGNVSANTITELEDTNYFQFLSDDNIVSITNESASSGGKDEETIDELKISAKNILNAQYRTVNKTDYRSIFKLKSNVQEAIVWGEQDANSTPNTVDYNKVYCSIIPTGEVNTWSNITVSSHLTPNSTTLYFPISYTTDYVDSLKEWIEPYKIITTYEEFVLPELIYFTFNFSVNIKRLYNWNLVENDLKNKLSYYFNTINRKFNETIDLVELKKYLLDTTEIDNNGNLFNNIKGINNLEIRDIQFYSVSDGEYINPYDYEDVLYPQFSRNVSSNWDENKIRNISLGFNQFPLIDIYSCIFEQE